MKEVAVIQMKEGAAIQEKEVAVIQETDMAEEGQPSLSRKDTDETQHLAQVCHQLLIFQNRTIKFILTVK